MKQVGFCCQHHLAVLYEVTYVINCHVCNNCGGLGQARHAQKVVVNLKNPWGRRSKYYSLEPRRKTAFFRKHHLVFERMERRVETNEEGLEKLTQSFQFEV